MIGKYIVCIHSFDFLYFWISWQKKKKKILFVVSHLLPLKEKSMSFQFSFSKSKIN